MRIVSVLYVALLSHTPLNARSHPAAPSCRSVSKIGESALLCDRRRGIVRISSATLPNAACVCIRSIVRVSENSAICAASLYDE